MFGGAMVAGRTHPMRSAASHAFRGRPVVPPFPVPPVRRVTKPAARSAGCRQAEESSEASGASGPPATKVRDTELAEPHPMRSAPPAGNRNNKTKTEGG